MPIVHDDEIRFYYGAYASWNADIGSGSTGIGMASMPRDRFAGLRPSADTAQVTLKAQPIRGGSAIFINAVGGKVHVEILNASGNRMPGFTKADAVAIEGDVMRRPVQWRDKTLDDLPSGQYFIRIHLENAEVFAITVRS
jgi:hypothetical protein